MPRVIFTWRTLVFANENGKYKSINTDSRGQHTKYWKAQRRLCKMFTAVRAVIC